MSESLAELIRPLLGREDFLASMAAFYTRVDGVVAGYQPICRNRGDCCQFKRFGHRLYVTTVELAYFFEGWGHSWRSPDDNGGCPFQVDGMCQARLHRPMGCRVFFCDPGAKAWQGPTYEGFLAELKGIGSDFGIAYRYVEWLSALKSVDNIR